MSFTSPNNTNYVNIKLPEDLVNRAGNIPASNRDDAKANFIYDLMDVLFDEGYDSDVEWSNQPTVTIEDQNDDPHPDYDYIKQIIDYVEWRS